MLLRGVVFSCSLVFQITFGCVGQTNCNGLKLKQTSMEKQNEIKIFEDKQVRSVWDAEQEKWYISIIDVIVLLTDQSTYQGARNYWKVLKHRLLKEGNETVTNCNQLKIE